MSHQANKQLEALKTQLVQWQDDANPNREARVQAAKVVLLDVCRLLKEQRDFFVFQLIKNDGSEIAVGTVQSAFRVGFMAENGEVKCKRSLHDTGYGWDPLKNLRFDPISMTYANGVDLVIAEATRFLQEDGKRRYQKA